MPPGTLLRPVDQSDPFGEWNAVCTNGEESKFGDVVLYRCGFEDLRLSISCKFQCKQPHSRFAVVVCSAMAHHHSVLCNAECRCNFSDIPLAGWANEEERRKYFGGEDALKLPEVIARLREDLAVRLGRNMSEAAYRNVSTKLAISD